MNSTLSSSIHQGVRNRREIQLTRFDLPYDYECFAHAGVKPYRNQTYGPATYSNMAYFPGEHFFYIFEKLNVFVKYCSLSLSLS